MADREKMSIVQGDRVETLWVQKLAEPGEFLIDNIPFEIHNLSLGDRVHGVTRDGTLYFQDLVDKSGHQTVRIRIAGGLQSTEGKQVLDLLQQHQVGHETYGERIITCSIPPGVDSEAILVPLEALSDRGVTYEQADPSSGFEVPVAPGSPAASKKAERDQGTLDWLQQLVDERDGKSKA